MRRAGLLAAILASTLTLGCESEAERKPEDAITLDQVPPEVMAVARKKLPDVTFKIAWKETEGGKVAYEVRGLDKKGGTRDVKVSASGEVLEVD